MKLVTSILFSAILLSSAAGSAAPREILGERADYHLSHDPQRTSGLLKSGSLQATVAAKTNEPGSPGGYYQLRVDYELALRFSGRAAGSEYVAMPAAYFSREFMHTLRHAGVFRSPTLRIDYLGKEDVYLAHGVIYPDCDRLRIVRLESPGLGRGLGLRDLVIYADIAAGIPALGAVRLDVEAAYLGRAVRAGVDLGV